MMTISLNGKSSEIDADHLLEALIAWRYTLDQCAVAVNGEFVPRSEYANTRLHPGDEIDIVSAVGGG